MILVVCVVTLVSLTLVEGYCEGGCYVNGHCYTHGGTWTDNCIEKRCRQIHSTSAIVETLRVKCKDAYGQCVSHGDEMTVNVGGQAAKCRCVTGSTSWNYAQCSSGSVGPCDCSTSAGCKSFGERWTSNDCFTYECQRNGGSSWVGAVVGAACKDANGVCRQNGERMPYIHLGKLYQDCLCTVTGTTTRYQCGDEDI